MIYYVAHPLGENAETRTLNKARALRWLRWLLDKHPDDAFCVPWYAYTEVLTEEEGRTRGLRDDLDIVRMCDGLALVGGVLSPGMGKELREAAKWQLIVKDYLDLGPEPPIE